MALECSHAKEMHNIEGWPWSGRGSFMSSKSDDGGVINIVGSQILMLRRIISDAFEQASGSILCPAVIVMESRYQPPV